MNVMKERGWGWYALIGLAYEGYFGCQLRKRETK